MFKDWIFRKHLELQSLEGRKIQLDELAEMIGCSLSTLSHWMNGRRSPGPEYIKRLEELFGPEVYDALEVKRPDPVLRYIETNWERLDIEQQRAIHDEVARYLGNSDEGLSNPSGTT